MVTLGLQIEAIRHGIQGRRGCVNGIGQQKRVVYVGVPVTSSSAFFGQCCSLWRAHGRRSQVLNVVFFLINLGQEGLGCQRLRDGVDGLERACWRSRGSSVVTTCVGPTHRVWVDSQLSIHRLAERQRTMRCWRIKVTTGGLGSSIRICITETRREQTAFFLFSQVSA